MCQPYIESAVLIMGCVCRIRQYVCVVCGAKSRFRTTVTALLSRLMYSVMKEREIVGILC